MPSNLGKYFQHGIYLMPGQIVISEKPVVVWTVLGSCVSIIFHDKKRKLGAICHAQLPEQKMTGMQCSDSCPDPCNKGAPDSNIHKYVTCSFQYMLNEMLGRGCTKRGLLVYLYGGSSILKLYANENVGERNVNMALKLIYENGLYLVDKNVGGHRGRKLIYNTDSGEIFIELHEERKKAR